MQNDLRRVKVTEEDKKPFKSIPDGIRIPENAPKMLLLHCLKAIIGPYIYVIISTDRIGITAEKW